MSTSDPPERGELPELPELTPADSNGTNGGGGPTGLAPTPQRPAISWRTPRQSEDLRPRPPGWRAWVIGRLGAGQSAAAAGHVDVDVVGSGDRGLHSLMSSCELWFATEASQLEREAVERAHAAAAANLPRADVRYGEVEEEAALAGRCRATFHGWAEGVRTRMQDAVQDSLRIAGVRLEAYEHEIGALSGTLTELRQGRVELRAAEKEAETGQAHLEVRRFLSWWKYVVLVGLLVLVDWIANVPVFTELLPKDPGSDAAWRELAARSEAMGLWGGPYRIWARAVHNIDASLLAFGVIVFLVYLAHVFGESLRRLVSHSAAELPAAALTIRTYRRQFSVPALLSLIGIFTVVGVLWLARDRVEDTTALRVAETEARLAATNEALEGARAAGALLDVGRLEQDAAGLRVVLEQRVERADYATVIARMNLPILLLNIVLALAAAIAGYLMTRDAVRGTLISPRAALIRRHLVELRAESVRRRDAIATAHADIEGEFARAEYLLASRPLRGWEAKADRLCAVIPRFRSENAMRRGIDTANIAAFAKPPVLELFLTEEAKSLPIPDELRAYRERHQGLQRRAAEVLARMERETPYAAEDGDAS